MGSIYAFAAKARISEMSNAVGLNTVTFGGFWVRHATVPPLGAPLMNVFPARGSKSRGSRRSHGEPEETGPDSLASFHHWRVSPIQ